MEYILWGTAANSKDWEEEVLLETKSLEMLENAKKLAIEKGFRNLRVLKFNFEKPNFIGGIRNGN